MVQEIAPLFFNQKKRPLISEVKVGYFLGYIVLCQLVYYVRFIFFLISLKI